MSSSINNTIIGNNISDSRDGIYFSKANYTIIKENNLINNECHAHFIDSYFNFWFNNYWDDWGKSKPRPIEGEFIFERFENLTINWIQFDWKPATEPYDI